MSLVLVSWSVDFSVEAVDTLSTVTELIDCWSPSSDDIISTIVVVVYVGDEDDPTEVSKLKFIS